MDPETVIDRGREDYLVSVALLEKSLELRAEEKGEEMKALSKMVALELAQVLQKMF